MRWLLMRIFRPGRVERELDAELRFHIDERAAALEREGKSPIEARRWALAEFGGLEPAKEQARDARGTRWMGDLAQDLRYTLRMMRRSPGFTIAAACSLAIGIGANAALFSVADALLLRPLAVARPGELSFLERTGYDEQILRFSHPLYLDLQRAVPAAELAAMTPPTRMQASVSGASELVLGQLVSGNWFDLLGVKAAQGHVLRSADAASAGRDSIAVISHGYWTRRFAASPAAVGSVIQVNGLPLTIIGVAPPSFTGVNVGLRVDIWAPVTLQHELRYAGNASIDDAEGSEPWLPQAGIEWLTLVVRTPAGVDQARVHASLDAVRQRAREARVAQVQDPERRTYLLREGLALLPGARGLSDLRNEFTAPLGVLMTTVAIVLLIGCINLASLLLARGAARAREFALRLSIGARRGRIVRQLLTESVALACLGGAAGLIVAHFGSQALLRLASSGASPIPLDAAVDWRLVAFTLAVSFITGIAFGVMPAIRLSRTDLVDAMKTGGRVAGAAERMGPFAVGKMLVVAQVALSLTLVTGAVLFLRTFQNLLGADSGFDRDRIVSARFDPRLARIAPEQLPALYERLLEEARRVPGVRLASLAMGGPVTGSWRVSGVVADSQPRLPGNQGSAREEYVGPDYFELMGMPLVAGRTFTPRDDARAPRVVVVNETAARRFFGDVNPIGHRIGYDSPAQWEIVGIIRDARIDGPRAPVPPMIYSSLKQVPDEFVRNLYVRVAGSADGVKPALARAVAAAEPALAVREVVTLAELTERGISRERLVSRLTGAFGLLAVLVACLGLYGTLSYSVTRRTNEIGVRLALGADPASVRWLVLRETLTLVVLGIGAGVVMILPAFAYLQSLLYGLSPRDPATIASAAAALIVMGVLAGLMPAIRASRVDPMSALRD